MLAKRLGQWGSCVLRVAGVTFALCAVVTLSGGVAGAASVIAPPATGVEQTLVTTNPSPNVGEPVSFSLTASSTAGPINSNAVWSFGDGQNQTIFGGSASHVFNSPGIYNVTVTGTSQSGQTVTASTTVRVGGGAGTTGTATNNNALPGTVAAITAMTAQPVPPTSVAIASLPASVSVDQPLTFSATATSASACGTIAGFLWDFGDGTPALTGQTVAHAYTAPGSFNVNLTVTDCSGATASASSQVHVGAAVPSVSVSFVKGWNLVAAAPGTSIAGTSGPLYTLQAGNSTYQTIAAGTPLTGGAGYWAYFPDAATGSIPLTSTAAMTVTLPAGAFVLIGNSASTPATVTGTDELLTYLDGTGYMPATTLKPGQGAWVFSFAGGTATITPQP